MTPVEENERWLIDGDCRKCRRDPYCKKACTVRKRNGEQLMKDYIRTKTGMNHIERLLNKEGGE